MVTSIIHVRFRVVLRWLHRSGVPRGSAERTK